MCPLMLKIGTEKNELIILLSSIASIGLLILLSAILTPLTGEMNLRNSFVGMVSTIVDNIYNLLFCFSKNISSQRV